MRFSLRSIIAATVVPAAVALSLSVQAAPVKDDLAHYFPIRTALAADKTDGVKEHADALAKSDDKEVAKAATELGKATDLEGTRKAFADISKALIATLHEAAKKGTDAGTVYVFECPMAKPYGKWLQAEDAIGNPYYGSEMLKCGKKVGTVGEAKKNEKGVHGDHGGHGAGYGGH